ncbi:MAG: SUMF1/EgtB/PvdO family nonheme iron enzyme [Muribaculaceae bacterium]|nr:SUMF1/EgtB/PvdO family nonheme iron enzyme [Muribaculaceae bacterium]MBO7164464.1 SUMF1/EgtB/PvdO family nonheme iron enzyme [Muribaculaceae bacterium]MBQ1185775.1 SUMF1/EgtB/PvdO family nonheme iron enzyme [Muribaculaceae bacterium]MBQ2371066.1 SUMF1/EgtB/PvdO family nonheme iron enzyme [Muribaculaceae bacterium]MBQ2398619.1 SUMF1/EgtB/PvdO family nonheme iron enzyme [Muribaculaceae bacterium]
MVVVASTTLVSCMSTRGSSAGGEVTGVGGYAYAEPAPYGMVLIDRGAYKMGPAENDSVWGIKADPRGVSVDAFWMDETEITNSKYKQFVFWVRDSIIRERLADPAYGGNEEFKIEEDNEGNPVKPYLNWNKAIPWRNANEDELRAIESVYRTNPITGRRELDPTQLNYRYEIFNHTAAAKRKNRLDPERREYNTDIPVSDELPMISKDTAYFDEEGRIVRETVSRRLTGDYDFLNTYIVNVYPDTTAWINDFDNAYNEPYTRMYFSHAGYNDYPVVGVSWEQANAFANWRTDYLRRSLGREGVMIEPFRLPTEAEWEFAARAGNSESQYPWSETLPMDERGCFYANFKPMEGDYIRDGHLITSPVGTFNANDFGLYDMAGNVSEWTSTAYTESINKLTSDMNPEYRYDAAKEDPYKMKRKIVRGGSWKDVAHNVRSDIRMWEYQNEQRSYIGFRCVRTQIGFAKGTKKR